MILCEQRSFGAIEFSSAKLYHVVRRVCERIFISVNRILENVVQK